MACCEDQCNVSLPEGSNLVVIRARVLSVSWTFASSAFEGKESLDEDRFFHCLFKSYEAENCRATI